MTGKTHKAIGTAVGVGMVMYGVMTSQPLYALGMVTAPFGAMLPDVDHCNTELGRNNRKLFKGLKTVAVVVLLLSVLTAAISMVSSSIDVAMMWLLLAPAALMVIVVTSERFKRTFPFLTKHRGIMHTLVIPVCMVIGGVKAGSDILGILMFGLALGYVSHLVADCLTVSGCPICFPLSTECLIHGPITTGTAPEYIGGAVLSAGIIYYAYMLGNNAAAGEIVMYAVLALASFAVMLKVKSLLGVRKSKVFMLVCVCVAAAIAGLVLLDFVTKGYAIAVVIGILLAMIKKGKRNGKR